MGKQFNSILPANPFMLQAGTPLQIINCQERVVGSIVLKKDTDITFGFSQENSAGVMVKYKTVACYPARSIYCVREDL
jgi:hypothetical protein